MGDEIEEYILKKLDNAIIESSSQSEFHLAAKVFLRPSLSQQFTELRELLRKAKRAAAPAPAAAAADKSSTGAPAPDPANLLREEFYYINNVLTEWQMITKKPFSISCESITSLTNLSQSLKKIKQDLSLKKNKQDSKRGEEGSSTPTNLDPHSESNVDESPEEPLYRWSSRYVDVEEVHGIEDKVLSMERLLVLRRDKNDPFKAFGIYGMAGVGKTTLCQCIFCRPKVKEYFLPRIWVCLSKQKDDDLQKDDVIYGRKEIVKRMLMCLGVDNKIVKKTDEKHGLRGLIFALRLQLTGKRYLIVLDDAWTDDEWFKLKDSSNEDEDSSGEKLAYGFPKGCGGTVIVTSRTKAIVKNMVGEEQSLRCLVPFKDKETCWTIFRESVTKDGVTFPQELEGLKEEIVKRLDGLPLAAKMMGQIKHQQILHTS